MNEEIDVQLYPAIDLVKKSKYKIFVSKYKKKIIIYGTVLSALMGASLGIAIKSHSSNDDNSLPNVVPITSTPTPTAAPEVVATSVPTMPTEDVVSPVPTSTVNPLEPAIPSVTETPVESTAPAIPSITGVPAEPTNAAVPSVTGTPAEPTNAAVPSVTSAPAEPTKPAAPTQPIENEDTTSQEYQDKIFWEIHDVGVEMGCLDARFWTDGLYLKYKLDHPDLSLEDVITQVNMGLYMPFYSLSIEESDIFNNDILINKYHMICSYVYDSQFDISKLNEINNTGYKLRTDVSTSCEKMMKAAAEDGITLVVTSGFVSYDDQEKLYNDTVAEIGEKKADLLIERPGYSYAQLGTKVTFENNEDVIKWLYNNAYKFGFVYVAPKGKEDLTGYTYNPTSLHFIGVKMAKDVRDSGRCFDEEYHRTYHKGSVTTDYSYEVKIDNNCDYASVLLDDGVAVMAYGNGLYDLNHEEEEENNPLVYKSNV